MSQIPEPADTQPQPTPIVPPANGWVFTLVGLLTFFVGVVLARVLKSPDDPTVGADVGDIVKTFGAVLMSLGGPLPLVDVLRRSLGGPGARVLTALVVGGVLAAGSILPGCGGSQYVARDRAIVDWWPGPPCHVEVRLDDPLSEPVVTVDAPSACEPAPQQTPAPAPEVTP